MRRVHLLIGALIFLNVAVWGAKQIPWSVL